MHQIYMQMESFQTDRDKAAQTGVPVEPCGKYTLAYQSA